MTAGSTVRLIQALISEQDTFLHVPAPNGLPGGYPVIANKEGVQPAPIDGLTLAEAITINVQSHRFDGIKRIAEDGTAIFRPDSAQVFRDALGYDCDRLSPSEAEDRAKELMTRFRKYAAKYGVDLHQRAA